MIIQTFKYASVCALQRCYFAPGLKLTRFEQLGPNAAKDTLLNRV